MPADPMRPTGPDEPGELPHGLSGAGARDREREALDPDDWAPEDWAPDGWTREDWDPADGKPAGRDLHQGADDWDPDADTRPAGSVFAQGCWGDELAPDPVLATLLDLTGREGLEQLDDDQLTGVLQAANRLVAWAAVQKIAAVSQLAARREADGRKSGDWRPFDHIDDEVAVALTLTSAAAGGWWTWPSAWTGCR